LWRLKKSIFVFFPFRAGTLKHQNFFPFNQNYFQRAFIVALNYNEINLPIQFVHKKVLQEVTQP
jgi:hypothetical protein